MSSPTFGPPSPDTTAPDVSTVTPSLDISSLPQQPAPPAPQAPTPDQSQRPSVWKAILAGALNGLAGSAGLNTRGQSGASAFASGLAAGAGKQLDYSAQQKAAQSQVDLQKLQTAHSYVQLQAAQRALNLMPDDKREQFLDQEADNGAELIKAGAVVPLSEAGEITDAQSALSKLHNANPWAVYSIQPVKSSDGTIQYQAVQFVKAPLQSPVTLEGLGPDGGDIQVPAGVSAADLGKSYHDMVAKKAEASIKQNLQDSKDADQRALKQTPSGNAKPQNLDDNGNPVWVPGVSADEKKKAELSENVVFNANNIASILARRPDLVGAVAGRFTSLDAMAGTNDPDITALQQDMHNIAIANVGIHGMRANDAVHDVERNILNSFRNGPRAIGGALKSTADSVQTFIDNARPSTYKTHSKNGGALRSMVRKEQQ
jgi:hypothetical protein